MEHYIHSLINKMTLEEKASLTSGMDVWNSQEIKRLEIPSLKFANGPHGVRNQKESVDLLGVSKNAESSYATCFPSGSSLASSWDINLIEEVGKALGKECQEEGVSILLGPGINIKRSPLCGRNFEYFSEDPYLTSELAINYIKGVQSQGVGTSLKHFAVNNQEYRRMSIDVLIDERTLREIYLYSFEKVIKKARPWSVMSSYNKVNGTHLSENHFLLTNILKNDWGFEGFVVSDWGSVNDSDKALQAGLDLEMPSSNGASAKKIISAIKRNKLNEEKLDKAVENILKIIFKATNNKRINFFYNKESHHQLSRKVARESMILLKNDNNILPLKKNCKFAVIGELAKKPRYQGEGSSYVHPTKLESFYDQIMKNNFTFSYAQGYNLENERECEALVQESKQVAKQVDTVIVFAGLPSRLESEGYDRKDLSIPINQQKLIESISKVQGNIIVVLNNGSPVNMPWLPKVKGVLETYFGGQAIGEALLDVIFGKVSPSGKLAETFPEQLSHNPSFLNFPGDIENVKYNEEIFVGYRYYDMKNISPLFPFGHGLSYTTFEYSDISISRSNIKDSESALVRFKLKNTGVMEGKEIVQLYINDVESSVIKPPKELKGFKKVTLIPDAEEIVEFKLDKQTFSHYSETLKDWHVESGTFKILIGSSSQDIKLKWHIHVSSNTSIPNEYHINSAIGDILDNPDLGWAVNKLQDLIRIFIKEDLENLQGDDTFTEIIKNAPLKKLIPFSNGKITDEMLQKIVEQLNAN